ncbi:MAG TPA: class I SAM-dependent methyltransferase [Blastocatellia bacterium]|nr:class I SAM-dependent methyltransferase [Blastocatellia bacterium]
MASFTTTGIDCEPVRTLASEEKASARFYNRWIGSRGPYGAVGRLLFGVSGDIYARPFIRAAEITAGDRVLEIGCGPAMNLIRTHQWALSNQPYIGVDISPVMIARAKLNVVENQIANGVFPLVGSTNLPIGDEAVDAILLSHLVKYLDDEQLDVCSRECRRVLRAGGRLALWEFAPLGMRVLDRIVLNGAGAVKLRSAEELQRLLAEHGFRKFKPFTVTTPWLAWSNLAFVASVG